ncbi:hypothetical protein [Mucilaginibacter sp.]|uniref:hypothetical protein n=1 Tax=Mucilaginibacter sp. TaxID=1882438 RepID=UPI0032665E70
MGDKLTLANNALTTGSKTDGGVKPVNKKFKSHFVKVTIEEINSIRPSVYKYLLP